MPRVIVLQHLKREGPGLFMQVAKERNFKLEIIRLDLGESIPKPRGKDILLIMGGEIGIKDIESSKYPYLKKEVELIKNLLKSKSRIIGVCLGAQLIAFAAGGSVEKMMKGNYKSESRFKPEVGWGKVKYNENYKKLLINQSNSEKQSINVLHWHGDRILLPSNAEIYGSSSRCREQFFSINRNAYGIQFHAEIENNMINEWIDGDSDFIKLSLGSNASKILKEQSAKYLLKSKEERIEFINLIFDLIT